MKAKKQRKKERSIQNDEKLKKIKDATNSWNQFMFFF